MSDELDCERQRRLLRRMIQIAEELERGGDAFLAGHYLHLRERAEAVAAILETSEESVIQDRA